MRIILWLASGVCAMAIGSAAAARPGASAPGGGPPSWSGGGWHRAGKGGHTGVGNGSMKIDRRPGRHHGRGGRRHFHPFLGVGIAGPVGEVHPYGNGFFSGGGGQIQVRGGGPYYDYDRAYPYEWASTARARERDPAEAERPTQAPARCTFENRVRVCRGW
jgi:hypothetical protein